MFMNEMQALEMTIVKMRGRAWDRSRKPTTSNNDVGMSIFDVNSDAELFSLLTNISQHD